MKSNQNTSSFVFLKGILMGPPTIREKGAVTSATLRVEENGHRIQVKLRGKARVDMIRGWQKGDDGVVMGNLESHFNTRTRSHVPYVRAVTVFPEAEGNDWEEFGLSAMLGRIYRKLAEGM